MKVKFDWISVLLMFVLFATLTAFLAGVFPYPYGWIVLTILLIFRLSAKRNEE